MAHAHPLRRPLRIALRPAAGLALLALALAACTPAPPPAGGPSYAQAPGVHFHNDVEVFTAFGGGSSHR